MHSQEEGHPVCAARKNFEKQTVIISGGMLEEAFVLSVLNSPGTDYIIGVDAGVQFLYEHRIAPDVIVGDFDSLSASVLEYYRKQKDVLIQEFDPVKDASDTEIALRLAVGRSGQRVKILGATGNRIDHIWANVQILKIALDAGVEAEILDPHNRIRLTDGRICLKKSEAFGDYFSLFPLGGDVEDFNISGAKYPLVHHHLKPYDSLCVSNQIEGNEAVIDFPEGLVILMETRD